MNDDIDNPADERFTQITHTTTSVDPAYNNIEVAPVDITVTDDDTAKITVSETVFTIAENVGTDTYTIVLGTQPVNNVVITATPANTAAVVSPAALTFTPTNWADPQPVTITAVNDDVDNPGGTRTATITHIPTSSDPNYNTANITIETVDITITDDDSTQVTLSGGGTITETSASSTEITVSLGRALVAGETAEIPLTITGVATVDYTLALKNTGNTGVALADETTATPKIKLSGADAQTAVLTFTAVDDDINEGDAETATITLANLSDISLATNLNGGITPSNDNDPNTTDNTITITITDNDTTTTTEPSAQFAQNTYATSETVGPQNPIIVTINLSAPAPAGGLTINYTTTGTATAGDDYTTLSATTTTTAGATTTTITITIIDDQIDENTETITLTLNTGTGYTTGTQNTTTINIADNDGTNINLNKTKITISENAATDTYTVVLGSQPTHSVTITPTSDTTTAATVSAALVFTTSNWNTAQQITATAVNDNADNPGGTRTATITHTATSTDPNYN
ncbi:MAG: hypothetical protein F4Z91_06865, partial [Acidimicrobiia bacterium]|nr:hypothetical protein [Acidimicrobiia bacterium]